MSRNWRAVYAVKQPSDTLTPPTSVPASQAHGNSALPPMVFHLHHTAATADYMGCATPLQSFHPPLDRAHPFGKYLPSWHRRRKGTATPERQFPTMLSVPHPT